MNIMFWKRNAKAEKPIDFDFKSFVDDIDDATVRAFFNTTHTKSRKLPILIAQYVYAKLETQLTEYEKMDALKMAEIRGGMRALRQFGVYYTNGIAEWTEQRKKGDGS